MKIRDHATRLINAECDIIARERRSMGVPYPDCCRADDGAGIKRRVARQLRESGQYGNVQLIVFILFSLARLIIEIIKMRNENKTWGENSD